MIIAIVNQNGSAEFEISFSDEEPKATTPGTAVYSLTNSAGEIINSLEDVSITPAEIASIVLKGDDLGLYELEAAYSPEELFDRYLIVKYTYNSDIGNSVPENISTLFRVKRIRDIDLLPAA